VGILSFLGVTFLAGPWSFFFHPIQAHILKRKKKKACLDEKLSGSEHVVNTRLLN
jgi:hypothetical protein